MVSFFRGSTSTPLGMVGTYKWKLKKQRGEGGILSRWSLSSEVLLHPLWTRSWAFNKNSNMVSTQDSVIQCTRDVIVRPVCFRCMGAVWTPCGDGLHRPACQPVASYSRFTGIVKPLVKQKDHPSDRPP